jgi:hypothetical protein
MAERSDCLFPLLAFFTVKVLQPRAIREELADAVEPVADFGG